jgi:hypothetical protein
LQANTERDVSVPLTAFDTVKSHFLSCACCVLSRANIILFSNPQKALRAFKVRLESVQSKLRKEGCDYETVKALAEVAMQRANDDTDDLPLKAIATFSLDEIEADQTSHTERGDLLDLSSPSQDQAKSQDNGPQGVWDPFNELASQNSAPTAPRQTNVSVNPFAAPLPTKAPAGSLIDFDFAPPVGTVLSRAALLAFQA